MRRIASLSLLLPLLASGCGGGSGETTTRAEFIGLADAICRNHQSRREDLESQAASLGLLTSPRKAREVAGLLRREGRNLRSEAAELQMHQPPAPDAALAAFLSAVRARAAVIDDWAGAYDRLDEERIRALQARVGAIAATAEQRAQRYGFHTCGN